MRITLIHNPGAGMHEVHASSLIRHIRDAGHEVRYQSRKAPGLQHALREPADIIAVAGGDGTVVKVAEQVPQDGPPLAILPLGNANNIATSLRIDGSVQEIVASWSLSQRHSLDGWQASGPWGSRFILEGLGVGAIANAMARLKARHRKVSLSDACRALRNCLKKDPAHIVRIQLDNETLEGEFGLVEALNFPLVGPRLRVAPSANPFDRRLDIAFIRQEQRAALDEWLEAGGSGPLPLEIRQAQSIKFIWETGPIHLGDEIWADDSAKGSWTVEVACSRTVDILVPA